MNVINLKSFLIFDCNTPSHKTLNAAHGEIIELGNSKKGSKQTEGIQLRFFIDVYLRTPEHPLRQ